MDKFKIGLVQLCAREDVEQNLKQAEQGVRQAAEQGAALVMLPENFAFIGPERAKVALGETLGEGPISSAMAALARELGIHLALGGIPERAEDPQRVYNTFALYGPDGRLAAAYRKIHLFDIHVPEAIGFLESTTVAPGTEPVVVQTPLARLGLTICYDLRFPELYRALALRGAEVLLVPAAFTLYTGKDHWHVLLRARAIENVSYVAAAAQFGRHNEKRASYGRSMLVDPWGQVLAEAPDGELEVVVATVDLERVRRLRAAMPTLEHVRTELFGTSEK
jgi:predicted amidohydrolase